MKNVRLKSIPKFDIEKSLEEQKNFLELSVQSVEEILESSPKGRLRCGRSGNTFQYFYHECDKADNNKDTDEKAIANKSSPGGSRGIYLSKEKIDFAKKVAQKEYCSKLLPRIKVLLKEVEKMERLYQDGFLEAPYMELCEARKRLVQPFFVPIKDYIKAWQAEKYEPGKFDENDTTCYITARGERVRSKSEMIIANELYRLGIPYRYEYPITLRINGKEAVFRPDFMVMNKRTGRIFYIEHLGMMDNSAYYNNTMMKLDVFEQNGLLIGRDVLLFHESSRKPININVVRQYIEEYLL